MHVCPATGLEPWESHGDHQRAATAIVPHSPNVACDATMANGVCSMSAGRCAKAGGALRLSAQCYGNAIALGRSTNSGALCGKRPICPSNVAKAGGGCG